MSNFKLFVGTVVIALFGFFTVYSSASAVSFCFIPNGCTGTSTAPSYGKVLVGGLSGEWEYVSTSTFGSSLAWGWPWTLLTTFATSTNATTTPPWFKTGFFASSSPSLPSRIDYLSVINSTTTAATTTSLAITNITNSLLSTNSTGAVVATGTIGNNQLQNSSVTVTAGSGLAGGGSVTLGSSVTLTRPWDFTLTSYGESTSTLVNFTGGLMSTASSTVTDLSINRSTTTNATTTNFSIGNLFTFNGVTGSTWASFCTTITGGSGLCDGTDNTSAGSGSGNVATSAAETKGQLAMFTSTAGTPATVAGVATTSLAVTAPITFSGTLFAQVGGSGGSFGCTSAAGGTTGCLTGTDWTTFNNKISSSSLSATYPLTYSSVTGAFTNAFGSTTDSGIARNMILTTNASGVITSSSTPTAAAYFATSTSATSTFAGPIRINNGTSFPLMFIGTSTNGCPIYGCLPGDGLVHEWDFNGGTSIEVVNANSDPCSYSGFWADGNIPTLNNNYAFFGFMNSGFVWSAACAVGHGAAKSLDANIDIPTRNLVVELASTTPTAFKVFGINGIFVMSATSTGLVGIPNASTTNLTAASFWNTGLSANQAIFTDANKKEYSVASSTIYGTGTAGQVLAWANGIPQWQSTSTCAQITGSAALCDGDDATGAGGGVWPFTIGNFNYAVLVQSTTTPEWFQNGLMASSTSYFVNASTTALTAGFFNGTIYVNGVNYAQTSAGIQSAIDQASLTCADVFLPAGTYTMTTRVTPKNCVHVRGAGKNATILLGGAVSDYQFYYSSPTVPLTDFAITDLTVDLNGTSNGSGIRFNAASSTEVSRVAFKNGPTGGWYYVLGAQTSLTDGIVNTGNRLNDVDFYNHAGTLESLLVFNATNTVITRPSFFGDTSPSLGLWQKAYDTTINDAYCINGTNFFIYYSLSTDRTIINSPRAQNCGGIRGANVSDNGSFKTTQAQGVKITNAVLTGGPNSTTTVGIQLGAVNDATIINPLVQGYEVAVMLDDGNGIASSSPTNWSVIGGVLKNNNASNIVPNLHPAIYISTSTPSGLQEYGLIQGVQIYDDQASPTQKWPIVFDGALTYDGVKIIDNRLSAGTGLGGSSIGVFDGAALGLNIQVGNNSNYTGSAIVQTYTVYGSNFGIATTTPFWALTAASSTGPQLALVDTNPANNAWTMRTINNTFYIASSTASATSTTAALAIDPNGNATFARSVLVGDGTASLPSFAFGSQTNTGLYKVAANIIGVSSNGTLGFQFDNGGLFYGANGNGPMLKNLTGASLTVPNMIPDRGNTGSGFNSCVTGQLCAIIASKEVVRINAAGVSVGTSTNMWPLTGASSTGPQFALSDGSPGSNIFTMRSINNTFYIASSTFGYLATSSVAAFSINPNGFPTFPSLKSCDTIDTDANGLASCGTDATGAGGGADPFIHPLLWQSASTSAFLFGTSTAVIGTVNIGTSTAPQLVLSDNSTVNNAWTLRSISKTLYIASSTATATSTNAAFTIKSQGQAGNILMGVGLSTTTDITTSIAQTGVLGSGIGMTLLYLGDSNAANSNAITYSAKPGSSNGASANLGFNTFINSAGASQVINLNGNGWTWKTDNRDAGGANNIPMSFHEIDLDATDHELFTMQASGNTGIATTTPWGRFSVFDNTAGPTYPIFTVATSSDKTGQLFSVFATTTTLTRSNQTDTNGLMGEIDSGVRAVIGTVRGTYGFLSSLGKPGFLDQLTVAGRINTLDTAYSECNGNMISIQLTTTDTSNVCGGWGYFADGAGAIGATGIGTLVLTGSELFLPTEGAANTNDGVGLFYGGGTWLLAATNTPVMEAGIASQSGATNLIATSTYTVGFTNVNPSGTTFETEPTVGCYFIASSTTQNYRALCQTSASAVTYIDTLVATTTAGIVRFRIEMDSTQGKFYIQTSTTSLTYIGSIAGANYPGTTAVVPGAYLSTDSQGNGGTTRMGIGYLKLWYLRNLLSK